MKTSAIASVLAAFLPLAGPAMKAQDRADSIAAVVGASCPEELEESEVERMTALMDRKVKINTASRRALVSSGLFSPYQAASIVDWRSRNGDILSFSELSSLDGFDKAAAESLKPFVSLESFSLPGASSLERGRLRQNVLSKGGWKDGSWSWGLKYRLYKGETVEAGIAARSNFSDRCFPPGATSFSIAVRPRSRLATVIVGDWNARFGQGLAMWSGFSLSGFSSSGSFCRKPSGITPAVTFSPAGALRGLAAEVEAGRFLFSGGVHFPGLKPWADDGKALDWTVVAVFNASWLSRSGQAGVTYLSGRSVSADFHFCPGGVDVFGEGAYAPGSRSLTALAGVSVPVPGGFRISALVRGYPAGYGNIYAGAARAGTKVSDEYGAALGLSRGTADLTLDARCSARGDKSQLKALLKVPLLERGGWKLGLRIGERFRDYGLRNRTDLRADLIYGKGPFLASFRGNVLFCKGTGGLAYLESGYKGDRLACYLRGTVFRIDNWDDRIYVYERDAPGNFSVPAYYGRGAGLSLYCGLKSAPTEAGLRWKLYLRGWSTLYSNRTAKPGNAGLKLQMVIDL
ncbi:MAG: helix-hairpin-helix domain-containing protein [Bacteroidales bacterium]|nr:helix-hairpin-helix domain-containing protein [Bacteroidales bacterium]